VILHVCCTPWFTDVSHTTGNIDIGPFCLSHAEWHRQGLGHSRYSAAIWDTGTPKTDAMSLFIWASVKLSVELPPDGFGTVTTMAEEEATPWDPGFCMCNQQVIPQMVSKYQTKVQLFQVQHSSRTIARGTTVRPLQVPTATLYPAKAMGCRYTLRANSTLSMSGVRPTTTST
jgi:hypothetical protein